MGESKPPVPTLCTTKHTTCTMQLNLERGNGSHRVGLDETVKPPVHYYLVVGILALHSIDLRQ